MLLNQKLAIYELVLFVPLFLLDVFVVFRHRSIKQLQWIFLPFVCLLRIIAAALEVSSGRTGENLIHDSERTVILDNIVLCLLLLTILEFLIEINDSTSPTFLRENALNLLHVPSIVATILCIVGATYLPSNSDSKVSRGETLFRAGWVIFLLEYLILADLTVIVAQEKRRRYWSEKHVLIALVASLPFLVVRFIYSVLAEFTEIDFFSLVANWNPFARLFMGVGMDFVVVALYTATEFLSSRQGWNSGRILELSDDDGEMYHHGWQSLEKS